MSSSSITPYWTGIVTHDFLTSPIEIFVAETTYTKSEDSIWSYNNDQWADQPHVFDQIVDRLNDHYLLHPDGETYATETKKEIVRAMKHSFQIYLNRALTIINSSITYDHSEDSFTITNVPPNPYQITNGTRVPSALDVLRLEKNYLRGRLDDMEAELFDYMGPNCRSCGNHTLRPGRVCDICWCFKRSWEGLAYLLVLGVPGSGSFGPILRQNPPPSLRNLEDKI